MRQWAQIRTTFATGERDYPRARSQFLWFLFLLPTRQRGLTRRRRGSCKTRMVAHPEVNGEIVDPGRACLTLRTGDPNHREYRGLTHERSDDPLGVARHSAARKASVGQNTLRGPTDSCFTFGRIDHPLFGGRRKQRSPIASEIRRTAHLVGPSRLSAAFRPTEPILPVRQVHAVRAARV
jgi:hypothetical protein